LIFSIVDLLQIFKVRTTFGHANLPPRSNSPKITKFKMAENLIGVTSRRHLIPELGTFSSSTPRGGWATKIWESVLGFRALGL